MAEQTFQHFRLVLTDSDEILIPDVKKMFGITESSLAGLSMTIVSAMDLVKRVVEQDAFCNEIKIKGSEQYIALRDPILLKKLALNQKSLKKTIYNCHVTKDFLETLENIANGLNIKGENASNKITLTISAVIDICEHLIQNNPLKVEAPKIILKHSYDQGFSEISVEPTSELTPPSLDILEKIVQSTSAPAAQPKHSNAGEWPASIIEVATTPISQPDLDILKERGVSAKTAALFPDLAGAILSPRAPDPDHAKRTYPKPPSF